MALAGGTAIEWDEEGGEGSSDANLPDPADVRYGVIFGPGLIGTYGPPRVVGRYTFEDFISQFDFFIKANLDAYIDAMNAARTDLVLAKPNAGAYYFQSLTNTEVPYSPFIFYGEIGTQTFPNGPDERSQYTIQLAIILENTNELQGIMGTRLLRYRECLKLMCNQGWQQVNKRVKMTVGGISPFPFTLTNQEATHMGIGVTIDIELG